MWTDGDSALRGHWSSALTMGGCAVGGPGEQHPSPLLIAGAGRLPSHTPHWALMLGKGTQWPPHVLPQMPPLLTLESSLCFNMWLMSYIMYSLEINDCVILVSSKNIRGVLGVYFLKFRSSFFKHESNRSAPLQSGPLFFFISSAYGGV